MREFDELNYQSYFDKMDLSKRQKAQRVKVAGEFEEIFLLFLSGRAIDREYGGNPTARDAFIRDYTEAVEEYIYDDDFVPVYVTLLASLIEEATIAHIDDKYYTSLERAKTLAANEANTVLNQKDFDDYSTLGYTKKRWITERDDRVRQTHFEVDSRTVPIDELFNVGSAVMRFPHDFMMASDHPEELANCRCSVEYIR